jgi:pimeloyl-ACP methyl ester carboxylesterase
MNKRRRNPQFKNSPDMGSYVRIVFKIHGKTDMGEEAIKFETKVHYVERGEGPVLLLIHGIGQSLYTWHNNIDYFANNGFRVIAVDLPGFGYSGHPAIYYTVEEYALIIAAFLDALKIKSVHMAAVSSGCPVAVYFAGRHPQRVQRMILISPGGPNENYPFSMRMMTTWLGHTIARMLMNENSVYNVLRELYFDTTMITNAKVDGYFAPYRDKEVRDTLAIALMHYDDTHAREMLKGLNQRVLVFSGADDKIHSEDMVRPYAVMPPGAKHIRLRNCGHFVHEEKTNRFNSEATAFLKAPEDSRFWNIARNG